MGPHKIAVVVAAFCLFGCVRAKDVTMTTPSTTTLVSENVENYDMDAIFDECNSSFRISMEYITSLNESGSFPDETDKTPKCFVHCMISKLDVMDEYGNINEEQADHVISAMRSGEMTDIISTCVKERTETCLCEKSYGLMKCVMSIAIELYDGE